MEILSFNFVYFVSVVLIAYYVIPSRFQNLVLLISSYYFYSTWSLGYVYILVGITLFNFYYGKLLSSASENKIAKLWLGIILNIIIFAIFTLQNHYPVEILTFLRTLGARGITFRLLIPIGFSYYLLEAISYLVDINRKQVKPAGNIVTFAVYFSYFPKLIAGPIERANAFLSQLNENKIVDNKIIANSFTLIVVGLLRTLVFAEILIILLPQDVFSDPLFYASIDLVIWILVYAMIVYNQFAGYSNIVRGVSGLFGIELTRNFSTPLFSQNFSEFWTRWHISLSSWLRDYVYLPMSRSLIRRNPSSKNIAPRVIPPMATMLISGLWHGVNLHLLLWGAIMGLYMVAEQILAIFRKVDPSKKKSVWKKWITAFILIGLGVIAMIPFRLDIIPSKIYLYGIIMANNWQMPPLSPFVFLSLPLLFDYVQYKANDEYVFLKMPSWLQSLLVAIVIIAIIFVDKLQSSYIPFVYP